MAPSNLITVELLKQEDMPAAIETIQQSFNADPFHDWAFDVPRFSVRRNQASLTIRLNHLLSTGARPLVAHTPTRRCAGVALWLQPRPRRKSADGKGWEEMPQTWEEWARNWWFWLQQVGMNLRYGRGGLNVKRYYMWKKAQAECQRELWTDPKGYWFLNILGTHPDTQRLGVGRALIQDVLEIANREGFNCYLESSKEVPNVAIYNKFGFKLDREIPIDDDGAKCTLYCMTREPKSQWSK